MMDESGAAGGSLSSPPSLGPCTVCGAQSVTVCFLCFRDFYCGVEHELQDRERHKSQCHPPWQDADEDADSHWDSEAFSSGSSDFDEWEDSWLENRWTDTESCEEDEQLFIVEELEEGAPDLTPMLPDETLLMVFARLGTYDLVAASKVSTRWQRLALDESLWRGRRIKFRANKSKADTSKLAEVLSVAPCMKSLRIQAHKAVELPPVNPACKIRKLTGINVDNQFRWTLRLLVQQRSNLVKLKLVLPDRPHLQIIQGMRKLRSLSLRFGETDLFHAPPLPQKLRELHVRGIQEEQLESVGSMTKLRRVSLHTDFLDLPVVTIPVCPAPDPLPDDGSKGVWSMSLCLAPAATMLSLVRAHAATVKDLTLYVASHSQSACFIPGLGEQLGKIEFKNLRFLTLERYKLNGGLLRHSMETCLKQQEEVSKHLRGKVGVSCGEGCTKERLEEIDRLYDDFMS